MRKWLISILLISISLFSFAQGTQSTGAPSQLNLVKGGSKADSAQYLPQSYANYPWFDSCGRLWFNKKGDSAIYFNNCKQRIRVLSLKDTALIKSLVGNITGQVDSNVFATRNYVQNNFATIASLSTVAFSGSYNDLINKLSAGTGISISGGNVISNIGVLSLNGNTGALIYSTLAGYGINDAYTQTQLQTSGQSSVNFGNIISKPTTLNGYGITDAVPLNRIITINGNSQDLSTNRSYNVGTVTSISATATNGISVTGSPITSTGTLSFTLDTTSASIGIARKSYVDNMILASGGNYVPITRTITINGISQSLSANRTYSVGTVTTAGYGTTLTSSGTTINIDTSTVHRQNGDRYGVPSIFGSRDNFDVIFRRNDITVGTFSGTGLDVVGGMSIDPSSGLLLRARSLITSSQSGYFTFTNSSATAVGLLQIGGTTSAAPGIGRQGAALSFRLADNSDYCSIFANTGTFSGNGSFSGTLTLPNNDVYSSGGYATSVRNSTSGRIQTINNTIVTSYQTTTTTGNNIFSLPVNSIIEYITITPANNETIRIGTTSGGTQVSGDVSYTAGTINTLTVGKKYSKTVAQTLFIQGASGSVTYEFYYK